MIKTIATGSYQLDLGSESGFDDPLVEGVIQIPSTVSSHEWTGFAIRCISDYRNLPPCQMKKLTLIVMPVQSTESK